MKKSKIRLLFYSQHSYYTNDSHSRHSPIQADGTDDNKGNKSRSDNEHVGECSVCAQCA